MRTPKDFYNSGKSFGAFLRELENYPAETLHETIEKFHDTRKRLRIFETALERDVGPGAHLQTGDGLCAGPCPDCAVLMDLLEQGRLPLRVTHNDTKIE